MSEQDQPAVPAKPDTDTAAETQTSQPETEQMPPWKVLLHNDDVNSMEHVTHTICELTTLDWDESRERMEEAHEKGVSLLLTTHKERAELYQEQFASKGLIVTIEQEEQ